MNKILLLMAITTCFMKENHAWFFRNNIKALKKNYINNKLKSVFTISFIIVSLGYLIKKNYFDESSKIKTNEDNKVQNNLLQLSKIDRIKLAQLSHYSTSPTGSVDVYGNLERFRVWAKSNDWTKFHGNGAHYDWWMFPSGAWGVNSPEGKGSYSVTPAEIKSLKKDTDFMRNYKEGVKLQMLAWGWDIDNQIQVLKPHENQKYDGYKIRLDKIMDSLKLFGEDDLLASVNKFFIKVNTTPN